MAALADAAALPAAGHAAPTVTDLRTKRTVLIQAGRSYLAHQKR